MNRLLLLPFVLGLFARPLFAQERLDLCSQVIGATGKSAVKKGNTWMYHVGEPVVMTFTDLAANRTLTQGFHQPAYCQPFSVSVTPDLADWDILAYPNPAVDFLMVQYSPQNNGILRAAVFDLLGRVVLTDLVLNEPDGSPVDCAGWLPGVYLLHLQDPRTRGNAFIRFVKI